MSASTLSRYLVTLGLTAAGFYGFCEYQAYEARKQYQETLKKRDNTRQEYGSFGMDWGYKADDIIVSQIDSGDLLMFHMHCKSFTAAQILECYKDTVTQYRPIKKDNVAIAFRNKDGVQLLANMYNKTQVLDYPSLLAHPGLNYLAIKKVEDFTIEDHRRLGEIVADKESKVSRQKSNDFLNQIFGQLGCLKNPIQKLDGEYDLTSNVSKKFNSSINVRTEQSKTT